MPQSPVAWVRVLGLVEACSFLLLLGVAMPLKYAAGIPEAVMAVGWIHGVLFIALAAAVLLALLAGALSLRSAAIAMAAAMIPFGPFLIDARLRELDRAQPNPATPTPPAAGE